MLLPGAKLNDIWDNLCLEEKVKVSKEVLGYMHEIQQHPFGQIGSFYLLSDLQARTSTGDATVGYLIFSSRIFKFSDLTICSQETHPSTTKTQIASHSSQASARAASHSELVPNSLGLPPSPLSSRPSTPSSHESTYAKTILREVKVSALLLSPPTSSSSSESESPNGKYVVGPIVNIWYSMHRCCDLLDLHRGPFENSTCCLRGITEFAVASQNLRFFE